MANSDKKSLTAAEISALWLQYKGDTMSICMYKYFLTIVEDKEIKAIVKLALQRSETHIANITEFLKTARFQIPAGFDDKDVNLNAPRLFSDNFILLYTYIMTLHGLSAYTLAITSCEREDIQDYYFECMESTKKLYQRVVAMGKSHPKFSSMPTVPSSQGIEFMHSTGILSNLIGDKRPLSSSEISNLFFNSKKTAFIRTLSLAFSQVAEQEDVRNFMLKNVKLAGKDADSFDMLLTDDDLSIPQRWDDEITNSTISPFSDKLMMYHAAFLVNAALSYYGAALGSSFRSDVVLNYKQVFNHALQAGAMCYTILVKYGWMEKQPEAINRKALAHDSSI